LRLGLECRYSARVEDKPTEMPAELRSVKQAIAMNFGIETLADTENI
jgi:hypothetical protein